MLNDLEKNNILIKIILKKLQSQIKRTSDVCIVPIGSRAINDFSPYSDFDFLILYKKYKPLLNAFSMNNLNLQLHYFDLEQLDKLHTQSPGSLVFLDSYYKELITLPLNLPTNSKKLHLFLSGYNILKVIENLKLTHCLYGKKVDRFVNLRHYLHFHKYIYLFSPALKVPSDIFFQPIYDELMQDKFVLSENQYKLNKSQIEDSINHMTHFFSHAFLNYIVELVKDVSLDENQNSDLEDLLTIQKIIV